VIDRLSRRFDIARVCCRIFYWNDLLFLLMFPRHLMVGRQQISSDVESLTAGQDGLFFTIITAERK